MGGECIKCYNLGHGNSPKNRGYWTLCKAFNRIRNWVSLFSKHQIALTISLVASPFRSLCFATRPSFVVCMLVARRTDCLPDAFSQDHGARLYVLCQQHNVWSATSFNVGFWEDTFHAHGCPSQLFHVLNTYEKCGWFLNPVPEQSCLSFSIWSFLILGAHGERRGIHLEQWVMSWRTFLHIHTIYWLDKSRLWTKPSRGWKPCEKSICHLLVKCQWLIDLLMVEKRFFLSEPCKESEERLEIGSD